MASGICKSDITAIKSQSNPPQPLKEAMYAVLLLLGYTLTGKDDKNWAMAKKALQSSGFINKLQDCDKKECTPDIAQQVSDHIKTHNLSEPEKLKSISRECATIMKWVINQIPK